MSRVDRGDRELSLEPVVRLLPLRLPLVKGERWLGMVDRFGLAPRNLHTFPNFSWKVFLCPAI